MYRWSKKEESKHANRRINRSIGTSSWGWKEGERKIQIKTEATETQDMNIYLCRAWSKLGNTCAPHRNHQKDPWMCSLHMLYEGTEQTMRLDKLVHPHWILIPKKHDHSGSMLLKAIPDPSPTPAQITTHWSLEWKSRFGLSLILWTAGRALSGDEAMGSHLDLHHEQCAWLDSCWTWDSEFCSPRFRSWDVCVCNKSLCWYPKLSRVPHGSAHP